MGKKCSWIRKSFGKYGSESTIYCAAPPKLSLAERLRIARFQINLSQSKTNPKTK